MAVFAVDIGNEEWKGVPLGAFSKAFKVPHALRSISEGEWDRETRRAATSAPDIDIFRYRRRGQDQYFKVGRAAETVTEMRRRGPPKYQGDYYPAAVMRMLVQLAPGGDDEITLGVAMPPSDDGYRDEVVDVLKGKHTIYLADGTKLRYNIKTLMFYDEPIGGMMNLMLNMHSKSHLTYNDSLGLNDDDSILVLDVGGGVSSLVRADGDGKVYHGTAISFDGGVLEAGASVSDFLLTAHKESFRAFRGSFLPMNTRMRKALREGIYRTGGREIDITERLTQAKEALAQKIKANFELQFPNSFDFDGVVITGGGGGFAFDTLVEKNILNLDPSVMHLSHHNPDRIGYANVMGGMKMMAVRLVSA